MTNAYLMKTLRKALEIPLGVSHLKWSLESGATIIGTETELVLKSRNIIPGKLIKHGFNFKYLRIEDAISSLTTS
jgi:NAD dependent epimerase/dehydratase family enzyme